MSLATQAKRTSFLAGRPDGGGADALVAQFLTHLRLRVGRLHAPDVGRVPNLDLAVLYPQVDRFLRLSLNHHRVEAGKLQFRAKVTAGLTLTVPSRQRVQRAHAVAPTVAYGDARQYAGGENEWVCLILAGSAPAGASFNR